MKTPNQLYLEVRDFHPDEIIQYLADHEDVPTADAQERWDEMLKFLVLCVTGRDAHAPSALVDTAWHAFVLHTERYEAFCLAHLGRFIHHRPMPNPVAQFQNSLEEVFTSFPDSPVRKHLWLPAGASSDRDLSLVGDCEDGGSQCIGECAEVGCHRVTSRRTEPLPALVAFSAA
ncbi:MAG: hypothetical protein HYY50_03330 [Candidatus Kerfeldbacteria bacterium]|nr:hypothetical protein [Candidatus Kerfeldbacteria bacterium]